MPVKSKSTGFLSDTAKVGYVVAIIAGLIFALDKASAPHRSPKYPGTPFKDFNDMVNSWFLPASFTDYIYDMMGENIGHYFVTYTRDILAGVLVYYLVAGVWHVWIYCIRGDYYFKDRARPTWETILDQIQLAQFSLFFYAGLPVFSEWLVNEGYTKSYYHVDEVGGWGFYIAYTLVYLSAVEVGIYWMHRKLHTNKFLYKYIHGLHHKYSKSETLTPWASIAFNPVDGILQACPYVLLLPFIPCQYITHLAMVFFTGVWATNIHDAMPGDSEPVMGSKYHTIHHTHYIYNFGQFFVFCDWFWGTLRVDVGRKKAAAKGQALDADNGVSAGAGAAPIKAE